jgi:hypothetical protein
MFGKHEKRIILPNYLFEELKDLPDEQLSFRQHVYRALYGKYTGLGTNVPPLTKAVKNELTMNMNATLAILQDEIRYAIGEGIGDCPDWTQVKVFEKISRIVALASGRIFVGRPLSRDEEWINWTINYTFDISNAIKDFGKIPLYLRPIVVPFLRSVRRTAEYQRKVAKKLKPQLNEVIEASKRVHNEDDDSYVDVLPTDQHNLAAWSIVSAP